MVAKFLRNIRHDFRVYRQNIGTQLRAAAILRGAFSIQVLGMVVNNAALTTAWLLLFTRFGTINGWSGYELVGLQGVNMLVFGIVMTLSVGMMDLPMHVDQGSFDGYITKPSSVLGQVASSNIDVSTIGDMLLGIVLTVWYIFHAHASLESVGLFLVIMTVACILLWCFSLVLPNLLAFYVYDSDRLARYFGYVFLDTGLYPTGVLTGALRTVLLTVVPGLFIGAVQIDILRGLHWWLAGLGIVVAVFWLTCSLWLFRRSLRRYESANLVGAR